MAKVLNDLVLRISSDASELNRGLDNTKKNLGGFQKQLATIGTAIAGAFAVNALLDFAKGIALSALELNKLQKSIGKFSDLTGQTLYKATGQVKALADEYEESTSDIVRAANTLSKEMGISFTKALDLITVGFLSGANASDELLDSIKEYPTFMKAAGFSAEEFISILQTQSRLGIFSDKGIDAIKEGTIRIGEMSSATADAIDGIGISSSNMLKGIQDGSLSMKDAIQQISQRITQLGPNSQAARTAIADAFGGAGEDAGLAFFKAIAAGFDNLDQIKNKFIDPLEAAVLESSARMQTELAKLGSILSPAFLQAKADAQNFFIDVLDWIGKTYKAIDELDKLIEDTFGSGAGAKARFFEENAPEGIVPEGDFSVISRQVEEWRKEFFPKASDLFDPSPIDIKATGEPTGPPAVPAEVLAAINVETKKISDSQKIINDKLKEEKKLRDELIDAAKEQSLLAAQAAAAPSASGRIFGEVGAAPDKGPSIPLTFDVSQMGADLEDIDLVAKFGELGAFLEQQTKLGDEALKKLSITAGETAEELNTQLLSSFEGIGNTLLTLGQTLAGIDWSTNAVEGMAAIAGAMSSLIGQIVQQIAITKSLEIAKGQEAIASGSQATGSLVAGAAKLPFPASLAAVFAALAVGLSIVATISGLSKKATGGLVGGQPGFTMVGEQGPELLQIGQPGRVYSASQTSNMLGGNNGGEVRFRIEGDSLVGVLSNTAVKNNVFG